MSQRQRKAHGVPRNAKGRGSECPVRPPPRACPTPESGLLHFPVFLFQFTETACPFHHLDLCSVPGLGWVPAGSTLTSFALWWVPWTRRGVSTTNPGLGRCSADRRVEKTVTGKYLCPPPRDSGRLPGQLPWALRPEGHQGVGKAG